MRALLWVAALLWLLACGGGGGGEPTASTGVILSIARTCHVIVWTAQSNGEHKGYGEIGPALADVPSFVYVYGRPANESSGDVFESRQGTTSLRGGPAYTLHKLLLAAGVDSASITLTQGSSFHNDWTPASPEGADILGHYATALSLLRATKPADTVFVFHHIRDQGTSDQEQHNAAYQDAWASDTELFHNGLRAAQLAAGFTGMLDKLCVQTHTQMRGAVLVPHTQRSQLVWVGGTPDPNPELVGAHPDLLAVEVAAAFALDNQIPPPGIHYDGGPKTIEGVLWPGGGPQWLSTTRVAPRLLEKINTAAPAVDPGARSRTLRSAATATRPR